MPIAAKVHGLIPFYYFAGVNCGYKPPELVGKDEDGLGNGFSALFILFV
jgi:hypothetical protein